MSTKTTSKSYSSSTNTKTETSDDFQEAVLQYFKKYKWSKPEIHDACNAKQSGTFKLNNTQKFVSKYFTPNNPNGILLWHSVGSGKTLSAVAVLSNFEKLGYNTLWVTRTTLKKDLSKALDLLPLSKTLFVISYKQFSNIGKSKGELYNKLINRAMKLNSKTNDPLYKTVVVIDEVHKLYTKDLKAQELHDIRLIQNMIFKSYRISDVDRTKVVLMSATPITENPMEIIQLLNLITTNWQNRFDLKYFKRDYLDQNGFFKNERMYYQFRDNIKDLVSYIDMSRDPTKFAQTRYKEILVPMSTSEDSDILALEKKLLECEEIFNICKTLGGDPKVCKQDTANCRKEIGQLIKNVKNTKYQKDEMKTKCEVTL